MAETATEIAVIACLPPRPRLVGKRRFSLPFPSSRSSGNWYTPTHGRSRLREFMCQTYCFSMQRIVVDTRPCVHIAQDRSVPRVATRHRPSFLGPERTYYPAHPRPFGTSPPFSVGQDLWPLTCAQCRVALTGVRASSSLPMFCLAS
jgi:hypothetical protein